MNKELAYARNKIAEMEDQFAECIFPSLPEMHKIIQPTYYRINNEY